MRNSRGSNKRVRIALDAMGGDHGPSETVKGAVVAARKGDVEVFLVGDRAAVIAELERQDAEGLPIHIVTSDAKISDDEHPVTGLRRKPQASILVAMRLLRDGDADALVTMGSTGAAMASASLELGLMQGLERPALGGAFMGLAPHTVLIDLGSNIDCRPSQLLSFGILGSVFSARFLDVANPRVALLSVGTEASKGNRLVKESQELFRKSGLNFVGSVEGMDLFSDKADVIVCDGFVGNIVLKFAEGMAKALFDHVMERIPRFLAVRTLTPLASKMWDLAALSMKTGAPLFGVNGVVVVGHGASRADVVAGSIATARLCVERRLVEGMQEGLARAQNILGPQ